MKRCPFLSIVRRSAVLIILLAGAAGAADWTDYGLIEQVNQQPNGDVYIVGSLPSNPTSCSIHNWFYFSVSDTSGRDKRLFAMAMLAFSSGKAVRLHVTDTPCVGGTVPVIDGIYIQS